MERLALTTAGALLAAGVALLLRARNRQPIGRSVTPSSPAWIDRADFAAPRSPWLVLTFTSAECRSCAGSVAAAREIAGGQVAIDQCELAESPDLHRKYGIDAVPQTVLVDAHGEVRHSFMGPVTGEEIRSALAEVSGS